MIEWRSQGVLIATRRHGETAVIADVFTAERGRYSGLVRGGIGRKLRGVLQAGAQLDICWKARLDAHLGYFQIEPVSPRVRLLQSPLRLAALNAVASLLRFGLPERQAHPALYTQTLSLFDVLDEPEALWFDQYLAWEMIFLKETGFGLNLACCAVTGQSDDLAYISPKSGSAVSRAGAGKWANRLLPFPPALRDGVGDDAQAFAACLRLTEFFLSRYMAASLGEKPLPEGRYRFAKSVEKAQEAKKNLKSSFKSL